MGKQQEIFDGNELNLRLHFYKVIIDSVDSLLRSLCDNLSMSQHDTHLQIHLAIVMNNSCF